MRARKRRLDGPDLTTVWCALCGCPRKWPCECAGIDRSDLLVPDDLVLPCPRHPQPEEEATTPDTCSVCARPRKECVRTPACLATNGPMPRREATT